MDIAKNGYIKLPYGFVSNDNNKEKIRFNLPLNYKKDVLFQKVPYFAEANNSAIDDVILGKKRDDLSIQKFLLSKGVLEDAILDNLDMIVTDRKFNNAGIRRKLDLKYPSIIRKPTASNFLFRDKKQFDVQNPVIGGLYNQLQIRTSDQLKLLKKAPNIKDLKIRNALERLKKFNLNKGAVDDDDDDDIPGLPRGRRGEPPPPPPPPPQDDDDDDVDDDDNDKDDNKNKDIQIKKFLLDKGNERIAEGLAQTSDGSVETRKIAFSKEITKMFPKVKEEELDFGQADVDEFKDEGDLDFLDKTDKYDFPIKEEKELPKPTIKKPVTETLDIDLDFFAGGDKNSRKLMKNAASYIGELNQSNRVFLEYLSSNFGARLLTKNKLKIHLESGQFFHNNIITNESIYDFLLKQQDETKRELYPEVLVGNDFELYVNELLANVQDNDYDLHTNSTAKFLLYNCNTLRLANRLKPLSIRHSQIVTNEKAISILQSNTWGYFIEQLLHFANGNISLDDFNLDDDREFERYNVIEKTSDNVNYCKQFYQEVFDDIGYFFQRMIKETPNEFLEPLKADLANEIYFYKNLKDIESHSELLRVFNSFYFKTGRFPGNYTDLILVPTGKNPPFVKSFDQISPVDLNDKFQNTASHGIAAVHFLAALNIFFGGEKNLSQDVMTELLHNLSYQALNFENTKVNIKFDQIIKLNKNLKSLIRDVDRSNIETVTFEDAVDETKDKIELMEEELVNNVLSGKKIEIPTDFKPPMPDSVSKIQSDTEKAKAVKRKTDESLNQVYETITKDVVTKARNDLVKSVSDYDGEIPTEVINNITSSFKQNDLVNKSVQKHVKDSIKDRNQQYFKQRKPPRAKVNTKTIKPQIKITDIVNRNISRSSSFSSIPLNEVEMLSRSGSLDSISTMKREYSDQEMISRPPSVSSIRNFNKTNIDLSFEQPIAPSKPIKLIQKNIEKWQQTTTTPPPPPKAKVEPKITVPSEKITAQVTSEVVKKKTPLTYAAKTVIAKREEKEKGKIKPTVVTTPFAVDILKEIKKKKEAKKIKDPPTVSLVNSIEKKSTIKKKTVAAKADSKIKHQELVAKWQNKSEDVEMAVPLQTGKRKKAIPKFNSTGEPKYKKEN